jgi:hypothetical protein
LSLNKTWLQFKSVGNLFKKKNKELGNRVGRVKGECSCKSLGQLDVGAKIYSVVGGKK